MTKMPKVSLPRLSWWGGLCYIGGSNQGIGVKINDSRYLPILRKTTQVMKDKKSWKHKNCKKWSIHAPYCDGGSCTEGGLPGREPGYRIVLIQGKQSDRAQACGFFTRSPLCVLAASGHCFEGCSTYLKSHIRCSINSTNYNHKSSDKLWFDV